jgi:uncharacterized SAM-binding protein YcdF (DUF218 family)
LALALSYRFYAEYKNILQEPVQSWMQNQTADCAVVLTGGAGRVREGFDLLSRQNVKKLIISGVYSNARLREIFPLWPLYGNLNENDVVLEKRSETTYGNAQQSLAIVEALKCRDVLLVTSRLHMHRAYQTFRSAYPENIYLQKHSVVSGRYETSVWENSVEATKSLFYSLWAY